ncbi:DUF1878 family protein [Litchfieldia salsa]|uniref:DUF1878 family protein n=1 Tax=Litchfieldia salsa TaxID=930152 RepID=A0A1H0UWG5_9BACI|nr:DUF1878 family protein [Litchfieldia salsa]SDP70268.1 Protein of unknown function [Litchfieldia salsa]
MESLEARVNRLEYYQKLLLQLLDKEKVNFYKLIVESNLQENEVNDLLNLCELMSIEYKKQKAEGLVIFSPLLTQFAGLLNPKLNIKNTIEALLKQGLFVPVMTEFYDLLKEND